MAFKRFQNIVAESRLMLPFASLVAIGACYMTGLVADMLSVPPFSSFPTCVQRFWNCA